MASTAAPSAPSLSPRPIHRRGGHGGGFGDPDEVEGEVAIERSVRHGPTLVRSDPPARADRTAATMPDRSPWIVAARLIDGGRATVPSTRGRAGRARDLLLAPSRAHAAGGPRRVRPARASPLPASAASCSAASWPPTSASSTPTSSPTSSTSPASSRPAGAIAQPRLRHRLQVDTIGLNSVRHRLLGEGERLTFDFDPHGAPAQHVLGAVYAAGQLDPMIRRPVMATIRRAITWAGPIGAELIASLSGMRAGTMLGRSALENPTAWALDLLGFTGTRGRPPRPRRHPAGQGRAAPLPRDAARRPPRPRGRRRRRRPADRRAHRGTAYPHRPMTSAGALLLAPGAGADRDHHTLVALEEALAPLPGRPHGLPVPQGRQEGPRPRPGRRRRGERGGRGARGLRRRRPRLARARRPLVRRPHVLDGGGRGPARRRARAAQLPAAPAGQAREAPHRALRRARPAVPVRQRHRRTPSARPRSSRPTPRPSPARSPSCGCPAATIPATPTTPSPRPSATGSRPSADRARPGPDGPRRVRR